MTDQLKKLQQAYDNLERERDYHVEECKRLDRRIDELEKENTQLKGDGLKWMEEVDRIAAEWGFGNGLIIRLKMLVCRVAREGNARLAEIEAGIEAQIQEGLAHNEQLCKAKVEAAERELAEVLENNGALKRRLAAAESDLRRARDSCQP